MEVRPCEELRSVTGGPIRPGGFMLTKRAVDFCCLKEGMHLLDLGCGSGESVELLIDSYGINAKGIDAAEYMIEQGKMRRKTLPLEVCLAEELMEADDDYDAILVECAFSHFKDQQTVLETAYRILKHGGYLIMSDLYHRLEDPKLEEITKKIEGHGFDILYLEDHTKLLRDLSVALIMKYGSIEVFLSQNCAGCMGCSLCEINKYQRPGYYLLIAQKE